MSNTTKSVADIECEQGRAAEIATLKAIVDNAKYPDMYDGIFGFPTNAQRAADAAQKLVELTGQNNSID